MSSENNIEIVDLEKTQKGSSTEVTLFLNNKKRLIISSSLVIIAIVIGVVFYNSNYFQRFNIITIFKTFLASI